MQLPVCDRATYGTSHQGGFDVRRHVIRPFLRVLISGIAFGYKPIEHMFIIVQHRRVGVLIDGQAGRGVKNENVQQTAVRPFGDGLDNLGGNEMKTAGKWGKLKVVLANHL